MTLRCRPGDIVQFIGGRDPMRSPLENQLAATMRGMVTQATVYDPIGELWALSPPLKGSLALAPLVIDATIFAAADQWLRPLRGGDGIDEMLRITGMADPIMRELREVRRLLEDAGVLP